MMQSDNCRLIADGIHSRGQPLNLRFSHARQMGIAVGAIQGDEMEATYLNVVIAQDPKFSPVMQYIQHVFDRIVVARQQINRPRQPEQQFARAMIVCLARIIADIAGMQDEVDLERQPLDSIQQRFDTVIRMTVIFGFPARVIRRVATDMSITDVEEGQQELAALCKR